MVSFGGSLRPVLVHIHSRLRRPQVGDPLGPGQLPPVPGGQPSVRSALTVMGGTLQSGRPGAFPRCPRRARSRSPRMARSAPRRRGTMPRPPASPSGLAKLSCGGRIEPRAPPRSPRRRLDARALPKFLGVVGRAVLAGLLGGGTPLRSYRRTGGQSARRSSIKPGANAEVAEALRPPPTPGRTQDA